MKTLLLAMLLTVQEDPKIGRLIDQLGGDELDVRDAAEDELVKIGRAALSAVRKAMASAQGETKARLERIAKAVTELRWMTDLAKAREIAARDKKPLLVFSTIGDAGGFV
jgi:hypothetical protein